MKSKTILCGVAIAAVLQLGVLTASAQTAQPFSTAYLYSASETNATLNSGTYIITAYGAQGGGAFNDVRSSGSGAAPLELELTFLLLGDTNARRERRLAGDSSGDGSIEETPAGL
jgi:hypothetical protein